MKQILFAIIIAALMVSSASAQPINPTDYYYHTTQEIPHDHYSRSYSPNVFVIDSFTPKVEPQIFPDQFMNATVIKIQIVTEWFTYVNMSSPDFWNNKTHDLNWQPFPVNGTIKGACFNLQIKELQPTKDSVVTWPEHAPLNNSVLLLGTSLWPSPPLLVDHHNFSCWFQFAFYVAVTFDLLYYHQPFHHYYDGPPDNLNWAFSDIPMFWWIALGTLYLLIIAIIICRPLKRRQNKASRSGMTLTGQPVVGNSKAAPVSKWLVSSKKTGVVCHASTTREGAEKWSKHFLGEHGEVSAA